MGKQRLVRLEAGRGRLSGKHKEPDFDLRQAGDDLRDRSSGMGAADVQGSRTVHPRRDKEDRGATVIRAEISEKNKYYIDKHRYYELKHFCLQYNEWKKAYSNCNESIIFAAGIERLPSSNIPSDLTAKYAMKKAFYGERIKLIERVAMEADDYLYPYILSCEEN